MKPTQQPESFRTIVGELPAPGVLPDSANYPFETLRPVRDGYVEREGVKIWYALWGDSGPWIAFAPSFQIVHTQMLKATVPYLSQHFRVVTMDARGNGRSDRPAQAEAYNFEHYFADFVAVLDAAGADRHLGRGDDGAALRRRAARTRLSRDRCRRLCRNAPGR
jgi:pimeloyl-ACP methyl ester carboxylesterase